MKKRYLMLDTGCWIF